LNFIYVHLNRVIKQYDLNMIYICGPGHGGPGMVANAYLEGTYSEVYTNIPADVEGMKRLFKQFSFPGSIPTLATSWHSNKFLNPAQDGAVLPILHLNGYKIANPTVLARISRGRAGAALPRLRLYPLPRRGP
jgi:xylulose-5-phosphate/fructose-6-phosphate phosphoketolase